MPPALYAISFKRTGHVLAICSFEKQSLANAAAAQALLEKLVVKHLVIAASSGQEIRVGLDELVLDPVAGKAAPADVIANPWAYQVQGPAANFGDGNDKQLVPATTNTVDTVALVNGGGLTVTLHSSDPIPHDAWVVFEGSPAPVAGTTLTNGKTVTMSITAVSVAANVSYGLLFLKDGVPATAAYVNATP
jgi:hypothetical protein